MRRFVCALLLLLIPCYAAKAADDAASHGAEIQKMFRTKALKPCSRLLLDGNLWVVTYANEKYARLMSGIETRTLDLNNLEELAKITPFLIPAACYN